VQGLFESVFESIQRVLLPTKADIGICQAQKRKEQ